MSDLMFVIPIVILFLVGSTCFIYYVLKWIKEEKRYEKIWLEWKSEIYDGLTFNHKNKNKEE